MTDRTVEQSEKKLYDKPKITKVQLVPQEAVLAVCKNGVMGDGCAPDPTCVANPSS